MILELDKVLNLPRDTKSASPGVSQTRKSRAVLRDTRGAPRKLSIAFVAEMYEAQIRRLLAVAVADLTADSIINFQCDPSPEGYPLPSNRSGDHGNCSKNRILYVHSDI